MEKVFVTTSWDDGDALDNRVAALLDKYGLKGTFYIAMNWQNRLGERDIKEISQNHEIGAHTINHPRLSTISIDTATEEIRNSKATLEDIVNKPIKMFAYPFGDYNSEIKQVVSSCGFIGARTTRDWSIKWPVDCFEMPTTLHIYPHPARKGVASFQAKIKPFLGNLGGITRYRLSPKSLFSWRVMAEELFEYTLKNGGIYHLWGHSWEIEKYKMWEDLEKVLKYISSREDVEFKTNGEII